LRYSNIIVHQKPRHFSHITTSIESIDNYKSYTNFPFLLREISLVAQLLDEGFSFEQIRLQITDQDILQIRSKASRKGALRTIEHLLKNIPQEYVQFLATGNGDMRRYTLLFLTLRINQLLREVVSEVLLDQLKSLDPSLDRKILEAFFHLKYEQETTINQWSKSTYQKVCSNMVLVLVRSGLLILTKNKGVYEIQSMPIPTQLKKQLQIDGLELYVKLMLN
jgi:Putative inner membrane protein (DUF1819)